MPKLTKFKVIVNEALRDLEHGSHNKAVSASYFAVRLLVEHLLRDLRTSKDDKIANALRSHLEGKVGRKKAVNVRERYLKLFQRRKVADHKPTSSLERKLRRR